MDELQFAGVLAGEVKKAMGFCKNSLGDEYEAAMICTCESIHELQRKSNLTFVGAAILLYNNEDDENGIRMQDEEAAIIRLTVLSALGWYMEQMKKAETAIKAL